MIKVEFGRHRERWDNVIATQIMIFILLNHHPRNQGSDNRKTLPFPNNTILFEKNKLICLIKTILTMILWVESVDAPLIHEFK